MTALLELRKMANADRKDGKRMNGLLDSLEIYLLALDSKIMSLEHGEFICKRCGLRKDSEFKKGDF